MALPDSPSLPIEVAHSRASSLESPRAVETCSWCSPQRLFSTRIPGLGPLERALNWEEPLPRRGGSLAAMRGPLFLYPSRPLQLLVHCRPVLSGWGERCLELESKDAWGKGGVTMFPRLQNRGVTLGLQTLRGHFWTLLPQTGEEGVAGCFKKKLFSPGALCTFRSTEGGEMEPWVLERSFHCLRRMSTPRQQQSALWDVHHFPISTF